MGRGDTLGDHHGGDGSNSVRFLDEILPPRAVSRSHGATTMCAELGFPAPLARGLFILSRSIGTLVHAWEETQRGRRDKGPIPRSVLPGSLT
ncbi:hypothetical protein ABZ801_35795 [Actinomadura sp. NPDC047616]|uniref:hypothetical protein n=1 Tax=Actinomadura sp. NPDC047616 TaxID=3155914 RepID=UPI0033D17A55